MNLSTVSTAKYNVIGMFVGYIVNPWIFNNPDRRQDWKITWIYLWIPQVYMYFLCDPVTNITVVQQLLMWLPVTTLILVVITDWLSSRDVSHEIYTLVLTNRVVLTGIGKF